MFKRLARELATGGALLIVLSNSAFGTDGALSGSLLPSIHKVEVTGRWSENEMFGRYRIIKLEEMGDHLVSRIEVQWLANEPAEHGGRVVESRALDEVGLPIL